MSVEKCSDKVATKKRMNSLNDCFAGAQQEFLICVTVHKATDVGVATGELYVKVSLDKMSKCTKTFPSSMNPFFNEYFVFELNCTLAELLRYTIVFELKKYVIYRKDILLGELIIDLHCVWNQANRSFFKQWGRLEAPINGHGGHENAKMGHGYLQLDLAIVSQHSALSNVLRPDEHDTSKLNKWEVDQDYDNIENNLLHNPDSLLQSNVRYYISFFRGYFVRKSSYMIQVSFAGFNGKSPVVKNTATPVWNYGISFAWTYPSLAQHFLILIFAHEQLQWKCVAEYELSFEEIAFKDMPALGPTYLHLYDPVNPMRYVGRLLMELRTESLKEEQPTHVLIAAAVQGLDESRFWHDDVYQVEFMPMQGDHVHSSANNYKFIVRLAEHTSNPIEGSLMTPYGNVRMPLHTKYFRQEQPFHSCMFRIRLPDNRDKFESDYFMGEIVHFMKTELNTFKIFQLKYAHQLADQAKGLKSIINNIQNKIKQGLDTHRFDHEVGTQRTTWDINRQLYLLEYFAKIPRELRLLRQKIQTTHLEHLDAAITDIVNDLLRLTAEINSLVNMMRVQDDWPDVVITLSAGGKDVGVCKLNAKHFLDLPKQKKNASTNHCWRVRSFVFRSPSCIHSCPNCGCNVAIVIGCLAIVVERERKEFLSYIAGSWVSNQPMLWQPNVSRTIFLGHIYVHQAKVRPGDKKGLCDAHLRVLFGDQAAETQTIYDTLSPIWNSVITFRNLSLPGSFDWYLQNPPLLSLEFYDSDKHVTDSVIGKGQVAVSIIGADRAEDTSWDDAGKKAIKNPIKKMQTLQNVTPPPLKWVPVSRNGVVQAEVLMSVEFIQVLSDVDMSKVIKEPELIMGIPGAIRPNMLNYVLEVIFVGLRSYTKSSSSSLGKRRIRIMMADLVLSSGLSTSRVRNSINFLMAYSMGVVSLPDQQEYWPAIIATDVALKGSHYEATLGAALIPNTSNFLQKSKTIKCKYISEYSDGTSTSTHVNMGFDGDTDEEDVLPDAPPIRVDSCWTRLKIKLGLHSGAYANQHAINNDDVNASDLIAETQFSWWTKFYNSMYLDVKEKSHRYKHRLVIYPTELEKQAQFGHLQDWAVPVQLVHGVKQKKNAPPKEDVYATLKLQIKLTPCQCGPNERSAGGGDADNTLPVVASPNPQMQSLVHRLTEAVRIVVRIYVVQGLQMRPRDLRNDSDCYVKLFLGAKTVSDRAHYVPNQSNPVFGRFFEMEAMLPGDQTLQLMVYDHDQLRDDVIGHTSIDLEDRWRTRHRAAVGIAHEYSTSGYNMWHDVHPPSEILAELCQQRGIPAPHLYGNVIEVDGMLFADETVIAKAEELQERLNLTVLKNFDKLPSFGYALVPEHVETRSLYRDDYPGVEQGKLQLWVELYEANILIPMPMDITPVPPEGYEVRLVVLNLRGIQMGDRNIFGKLMSDIFVRGWCQDAHKSQSTDIHYRSFAGEAAFNWRMIFPLKYSPNEDMMVIRRKSGLNQEIEIKRPPVIYLQVWDKDVLSANDYLGSIELNLSNLEMPYSSEGQCGPYGKKRKCLNLFKRQSIHGWFPLVSPPKTPHGLPVTSLTGKMELRLNILSEMEASNSPAGLGREPPMALDEPYRADTAFNPLTHPFKSFTKILWPAIRKYVFIGLLLIFAGLGIVIFFANLPNKIMSIPLR